MSDWISVADRLPTKSDATKDGRLLAVLKLDGSIRFSGYDTVANYPKYFDYWMSVSEPPERSATKHGVS